VAFPASSISGPSETKDQELFPDTEGEIRKSGPNTLFLRPEVTTPLVIPEEVGILFSSPNDR
jgi:hypothetical protein